MCSQTAFTTTGELGIVFDDPNLRLAHPITQTHECMGAVHHTSIAGLTIHRCQCGATFYNLAEALTSLVIIAPALAELIKKHIKQPTTFEMTQGNDKSQE